MPPLSTFTADTTSKLNIFRHDGYSLCMDGTQVSVLKQANKVSLGCFLQGQNCSALKPQVSLKVLSNFTNKTLKRCLTNQKIGRLLVFAYLPKGNSSRTVSVWLLYTSCCWCRLACGLKQRINLKKRMSNY